MIVRLAVRICIVALVVLGTSARAQDVPGIEICTVEKTMERRTSCLQSNVEFLHKTMTRLDLEHRQKLEAARAQIEALKASLATLQKVAEDLRVTQQKMSEDSKKKPDGPPKEASPAKDASPKDGGAKEGGK
jgi:DNA-binding protein H-NS